MNSLREEARKVGGEEAVKMIDLCDSVEKRLLAAVTDLVAKEAEGKEGKEREYVLAGICEALSAAYANAAVAYAADSKTQRLEATLMAIQSLSGCMSEAFDDHDAKANGVDASIKEVVSKFGPLPDKEEDK